MIDNLVVGQTIAATTTLTGSASNAYIYADNNTLKAVQYRNSDTIDSGLSDGGIWDESTYNTSLTKTNNIAHTYTATLPQPGDPRLWSRGYTSSGYMIGADNNGGYMKVYLNGVYNKLFVPSFAVSQGWWYAESFYFPEYGGLVWLRGDNLYVGVRQTSQTERTLLKFKLSTAQTEEVAYVANIGSSDIGQSFWMTQERNGKIHILSTSLVLSTYDEDLNLISTSMIDPPPTGFGIRGFGVDEDVLVLVLNSAGTVSGALEVRYLPTGEQLSYIPSVNFYGEQSTRVIFTDDSIYVQTRNTVSRVEFRRYDLKPFLRTPRTKVYELEKGWSFDGNYIPHFLELNWYWGDNPVDFTGLQKVRVHGLTKGFVKLSVSVNGMETDNMDYLPFYSEPQIVDLPRNPYYVTSDYVPATNYTDVAARGLSIQMKFEGTNRVLNAPEPSHVLQVLVLQTVPTGQRSH